jgi:hypothetical protein
MGWLAFSLGAVCGIFCGANLGLVVLALCVAAGRAKATGGNENPEVEA